MPETVNIPGGHRQGRSLGNEAAFRAALADGKRVFTGPRNGVFFEVTIGADNVIAYTALPKRPDGV